MAFTLSVKGPQSTSDVDADIMTTKEANTTAMNRRAFLTTATTAGGAMVLGFWLPPTAEAGQSAPALPYYREPMVAEINAWLTIAPDDTVTIRIGQTEMGNGVFTSNAMIVAEELQCDWKKVRSEYASANRNVREKAPDWTLPVPGTGNDDAAGGGEPAWWPTAKADFDKFIRENPGKPLPENLRARATGGVYRRMATNSSGSVREGRYYLQLAGAEARERLLLAAATEWGVPASSLVAKDGVITHAASKRRTTYGAMAAKAANIQLPDPSKIKLKTPDKFWLMGTEQKNLDVPLKVTGQAKYAIDVRLPGMLYAAAKSCPVYGGGVKSHTFDAIKNMPGVRSAVLFGNDASKRARDYPFDGHISGGVAVVADTWWHAKQALDKMPIEWDYGPDASVDSASLLANHFAALKSAGTVRSEAGNIDAAMGRGVKVVEATYTVPYLSHACMEPGGATAIVTANRVDLWTGSQQPDAALRFAADEAGVAPENVYVHTMFLGSGWGIDNQNTRANQQAVAIAKTLNGRPVKLLWTREEDWTFGLRPRPMGVCTMKAAVDAAGWPIAIDVHTVGQEYGGDQQYRGLSAWPYYVPNYRYTTHIPKSHVPCVPRRATGSSTNAFYQESFVDELAHAAGKDSYQYRRELVARNPLKGAGIGGFTSAQRGDWLRALDMVVKMSGWGTPLPEGWARGIAIDDRRRPTRNSTTAVAEVHTVEVTRRGQVRLHRVDVVFDQGYSFVNPVSVRKQIEGQMAWGWSDTMYQAATMKDGRCVESNFDSYTISRMNEYPPEINIQFMKTDHWLYGLGEEAIQQVAPAIVGAVFTVTGKRIRSLPLKNHDLSWGA
jgi:isoquinoline 1-oxidoreductase beta subunit